MRVVRTRLFFALCRALTVSGVGVGDRDSGLLQGLVVALVLLLSFGLTGLYSGSLSPTARLVGRRPHRI